MTDEEAGPEGIHYSALRGGVVFDGLVVRRPRTLPLGPRPHRPGRAAILDFLAGNSTLGVHLVELTEAEPDGHRHADETTLVAIAGSGTLEVRQADDGSPTAVALRAGDLVTIPMNAWHRVVPDPAEPARLLFVKTSRLIRKLFHDGDFNHANPFRFRLRYDDEPGFFAVRKAGNYGKVRAHAVRDLEAESLAPDPAAGEGVAINRYQGGGHRLLDHALVEVAPGGRVRPHRPLAEEILLVLAGRGRTELVADDGRTLTVTWAAGDLIAPPFGWTRSHVPEGDAPARWLRIGNGFIERVLGVKGNTSLDGALPVRDPGPLESDRSALDAEIARAAAAAADPGPPAGDAS
ncbi:MAG: cupin domain-containing protein [Chloroflexota bacterium]